MYAVGEILEVIRPFHENRERQSKIAEVLNKKGYRTKADREWTAQDVSFFAKKRGMRWNRKYKHGKTKRTVPTVKAAGSPGAHPIILSHIVEVGGSDLSSDTKSYLIGLLVANLT